jgi:hypothetical protein
MARMTDLRRVRRMPSLQLPDPLCSPRQAGIPCLEVFLARGADGELRQQASVLRAAAKPRAEAAAAPSSIVEALAAGGCKLGRVSARRRWPQVGAGLGRAPSRRRMAAGRPARQLGLQGLSAPYPRQGLSAESRSLRLNCLEELRQRRARVLL